MSYIAIPLSALPKIAAYMHGNKAATDDELVEIVNAGKQHLIGKHLGEICASLLQPVLLSIAAQNLLEERHDKNYVNNVMTYGTPFPTRIDITLKKMEQAKN